MHQPEFHGMLGVFGTLLDVETRQQLATYVAQLHLTSCCTASTSALSKLQKLKVALDTAEGRPHRIFLWCSIPTYVEGIGQVALYQCVPQACPHHFATGDVYHLLDQLRHYADRNTHYPAPRPGLSGLLSAAPSGNSVHRDYTIFLLCFDSMMGWCVGRPGFYTSPLKIIVLLGVFQGNFLITCLWKPFNHVGNGQDRIGDYTTQFNTRKLWNEDPDMNQSGFHGMLAKGSERCSYHLLVETVFPQKFNADTKKLPHVKGGTF